MRLLHALARLLLSFGIVATAVHAQSNVPVVMLSDIHFDPFHDPAKLPELRTEPIQRWPAILGAPATPTQPADLQALQAACNTRSLDTAWPLLQTTLAAAHMAEPHPLFVTLTGDLLAHDFPCRFNHLTPAATDQDLAAFAVKTIQFVTTQVESTFPHAPTYTALGNNDSGCNDYRETPGDQFMGDATRLMVGGAAQTSNNDAAFTKALTVSPDGDYSVPLPPPLNHARLIVLQNIFDARQYTTCASSTDRTPERTQIDWLRAQLTRARAGSEHVWLIAHIPPGVDVFTSYRRFLFQPAGMCAATPTPFLADTTLQDTLLDFADIVRLALFGHTHMDEFRVIQRNAENLSPPEQPGQQAAVTSGGNGIPSRTPRSQETSVSQRDTAEPASLTPKSNAIIPAKLVPSVTPFFGNHPAFLVASVDPRTAVLKDWRTFVSPGPDGSTPPWAEAYRFTAAYHLPDFSAGSALKLADDFTTDKTGQAPASTTFREHFYAGDLGLYALGLAQIWPAYACSVRENRPSTVQQCICAALPASRTDPQP